MISMIIFKCKKKLFELKLLIQLLYYHFGTFTLIFLDDTLINLYIFDVNKMFKICFLDPYS